MTLRMYAASLGSPGVHDFLAEGVELATQRLDVGGRQVRGRVGTTGRLGVQHPLLAVDQTQVWVDAGVDRRGGGREGSARRAGGRR
jgi:hypothetical protein